MGYSKLVDGFSKLVNGCLCGRIYVICNCEVFD